MDDRIAKDENGAGRVGQGIRANLRSKIRSAFSRYFSHYVTQEKDDGSGPSEVSVRLRRTAAGLLFGIGAFFFSRARGAFGTYPFGLALIGAGVQNVPFVYLGAVTGALFCRTGAEAVTLFTAQTVLFLTRLLVSRILVDRGRAEVLFGEPLMLRIAVGAAVGAANGLWNALRYGFLYYDLFGLVFLTLAVPVLIRCYSLYFEREEGRPTRAAVGLAALAASAVYALRPYAPLGCDLAAVLAGLLILYTARRRGALWGGAAGVICGLAVSPVYAPAFALAGMTAGVLYRRDPAISSAAACFVGIACGFATGGFEGLRATAPGLLIASLLTAPLFHLKKMPPFPIGGLDAASDDPGDDASLILKKQREQETARFEALSEAFGSLSDTFFSLSDRQQRPDAGQARAMTASARERVCAHCERAAVCWGSERSATAHLFEELSGAAAKKGHLSGRGTPEGLKKRCVRLEKIVEEINASGAAFLEEAMKSDKTSVSAMNYRTVSRLLSEAAGQDTGDYDKDEALTARLREVMPYLGIRVNNIVAYGSRRKTVIAGGVDLARLTMTSDELKERFSRLCGITLDAPSFSFDGDYVTMTLTSRRRFSAEAAQACGTAARERLCGDSTVHFDGRDDRCYTLISDGMGSGREAALTSRLCEVFLQKMLSAGNSVKISVEMLSDFLRGKREECFATVDLCEIDLMSGEAGFVKSGAAPSFILRHGSVFRIGARTLPMGITREINAEQIRFSLEPDDVVVMISDGIAQDYEDGIWLVRMLAEEWEDDLDAMARRILARAETVRHREDDATVALVRLTAA